MSDGNRTTTEQVIKNKVPPAACGHCHASLHKYNPDLMAEIERLRAALTTIRDASYSTERGPAFECARIAHQALEGVRE